MTLTLSHGPWSVTIAKPADSRPVFEPHFTLNECAQVDTTYHWNWKGQSLDGVSNCTFSFANLQVHGLTTWSTSLSQRAWYDTAPAGNESDGDSDPDYVPIELSARFFWESDVSAGRAAENWPSGT
ncbi:hypothetical protein D3C77_638930 [compost metagenome]